MGEPTTPRREIMVVDIDFWRWSSSDLVSNATRGRIAEFLVARALGVDGGIRNEWDAKETLNPLDVSQWFFFLLNTSILNPHAQKQRRISSERLVALNA